MSTDYVNPPESKMSGLLFTEAREGFKGHLGGIRLIEFASDDRRFLCADLAMGLSLYEDGVLKSSIDLGHDDDKTRATDRIHGIVVSEDGSHAYVAAGLYLRCIDLNENREVWRHRSKNFLGFLTSCPRVVGVSKRGDVFVSSDNSIMEVLSPEGKALAKWKPADAPLMLSRMPNGSAFVGSDSFGLTVWDPDEARRITKIRTGLYAYGLMAFPTSNNVLVRTIGGVAVFDLLEGSKVAQFPTAPGLPYVDVSAAEDTILVGHEHGVAIYNLQGELLTVFEHEDKRILTARFSPSGREVFAGTDAGTVTRMLLD